MFFTPVFYQSANDNSKSSSNPTNEIAKLEQNNPNPFMESTVIKFYIPSYSLNAVIKVYSMSGIEMKSFNIEAKGNGAINVSGNTFAPGTYVYTLIIDGKQVDSKYMTLTK